MNKGSYRTQSGGRQSPSTWLLLLLGILLALALASMGYLLWLRLRMPGNLVVDPILPTQDDVVPMPVEAGDCVALLPLIPRLSGQDQAQLLQALQENFGTSTAKAALTRLTQGAPITGSALDGPPPAHQMMDISATVHVEGGVLSVSSHAESRQHLAGGGADSLASSQGNLPFLMATDATGLGAGWQMMARIEPLDQAGSDCWAMMLPQAEILRIYGNESPSSHLVQPARIGLQDRLVMDAEPHQGMGMYIAAPSLTGAPLAFQEATDHLAVFVVCLIAAP